MQKLSKTNGFRQNLLAHLRVAVLLCCSAAGLLAQQQRFNSEQNNQPIPDFDAGRSTWLEVPVLVSGLPERSGAAFGLEAVQLAVRHPYVSDVKVVLYSPAKTEVWLTNRNGRDGKDYIETRFAQNGYRGLVSNGAAPFLGEYVPDGQLSYFNDGQNPNGLWALRVYDLKSGDTGISTPSASFSGPSPLSGWHRPALSAPPAAAFALAANALARSCPTWRPMRASRRTI